MVRGFIYDLGFKQGIIFRAYSMSVLGDLNYVFGSEKSSFDYHVRYYYTHFIENTRSRDTNLGCQL